MHCVGRTWDLLNLVVHITTTASKKGYCIHIDVLLVKVKSKAVPVQVFRVPGIRHIKVVRLSALRTAAITPHEISLVLISVSG